MSTPALLAGDYVIYNLATTVADDKLAVTFHDTNTPPTVEKLGSVSDNSQIWKVVDSGFVGLQAIAPVKDLTLQTCWGSDQSVNLCTAAGFVWSITEADNGYTILDSGSAAEWGITTGLANEKITLEALNGPPAQRWVFEKVATQ